MDIIIWISIGVFLLLPYYQKVFVSNSLKVRRHILVWISFNVFMSLVYYFVNKQIYSTAFVILISSSLYYFFSYMLHAKKIAELDLTEELNLLKKTKSFQAIKRTIFISISVFLIYDIVLIYSDKSLLLSLDKVYFVSIIVIAYIQIIKYEREGK